MAQNKAALLALINSNLPDNTTGAITPQKHREVETQIFDSALNVVETTAQTVVGPVVFGSTVKKGTKDVLVGSREVEILRASSTAASQLPSALGTALQVEFGPAQTLTKLTLSAAGAITCNVTGYYAFRFKMQKGRDGASGTSILMSRILLNGVQVGISSAARMTSTDPIYIVESRVAIQMNAGDVLALQIIRDSAGANFGGLYAVTSSHGWNLAPTALLVASEIEGLTS